MTTTINPRLLAKDTLTNVEAYGGSTLSLVAGVGTPTSGYVVSLAGHEKRLQRFQNGPISRNFVEYYIDAHRAVLAQPGRYLGAWVFEGDLYLDVSEVHTEIKTAVELGVQRQQLAIWHIDSDCEISLTLGRRTTLYDAQQAADQILRDIRDAGQTEEAALTTTDVEGTLAYATGKTDTPPADWGSKLNDAGQVEPDPEVVGAPSPFEVIGHGLYSRDGDKVTFERAATTEELSTLIDGDPWRGEDRVQPWNAAPPLSNETARQAWGTLSAKGREALRAFWLDNA